METEYSGLFFVWTKKGRRPRFHHDTHESALKEAQRLAAANPGRKFIVQQFLEKVSVEPTVPMVGTGSKEPDMKQTYWYGVHNDETRFAKNENSLKEQGITNPQSFSCSGEVTGLNLIDEGQSNVSSQSPQTA
jgi:hypothetical protein